MPEYKKESLVQKQQQSKPKIEEMIPEYLDGESKQSIIDFMDFCYAKGIKCKWSATNRWKLVLKGEGIGMVYIGKSPCIAGGENFENNLWYTHINADKEVVEKENLTEIIHRNILSCAVREHKTCTDIVDILGKEIKGACPVSGRRFANPDAETLECIKKMIKFKLTKINNCI